MKNEKRIWLIEQYAQKAWMVSLALMQEAARAGNYGKGYAVVAHEARILADKLYDYAAEVRFGENPGFKGIVDFSVMFTYLAANTTLEILHMADINMDFNIPKSMAVFAEELRKLAVKCIELADPALRKKPFVIPEVAVPAEGALWGYYFLYAVSGYALLENPKNILEIVLSSRETITGKETFSLRGVEIPLLDGYRLLNLPYTQEQEQPVIIINHKGKDSRDAAGMYAVPIDSLDTNALFRSQPGSAVSPEESHAFAAYSRECWEMAGGDVAVFIDWEKLAAGTR